MTTLADIEDQLPWGFHDAHLEGLTVDWIGKTLSLLLRLPMTKRQDVERRARVHVTGLFFCSIEPPCEPGDGYQATPEHGLWIDADEGPSKPGPALPVLPTGVFLHHLYVQDWNCRSIHIAARDARVEWLGEEAPRVGPGGALFPGNEVPDPK